MSDRDAGAGAGTIWSTGWRARAGLPSWLEPRARAALAQVLGEARQRGRARSARRSPGRRRALGCAGARAPRAGFRVLAARVSAGGIELAVAARDARALARGMQGLAVRLARALNRVWGRRGSVFAERYHARALERPERARRAGRAARRVSRSSSRTRR